MSMSERPTLGSAAELLRREAEQRFEDARHLASIGHQITERQRCAEGQEFADAAIHLEAEQARIAGIEAVLAEVEAMMDAYMIEPERKTRDALAWHAQQRLRALRGSSDTETTEGGTDNGN